ncbi:MAG: SEC-C domain-containing protein, partial [Bacteroidales bacterium]|nr:SEC-C domain-containing protein [Bacteroidales bacterium]
RAVAVTPDFDEATYEKMRPAEIAKSLEESLNNMLQRRSDAMVELSWPIIKHVYDTKRMFYQNIALPISDGKKVYTILVDLRKAYESHGKEIIRAVEKTITLRVIDEYWKDHLRDMDDLKQSVQNAAYEQKDPILVYKTESFDLFITVLENINKDVLAFLMRAFLFLRQEQDPDAVATEGRERHTDLSRMQNSRPDLMTNSSEQKSNTPVHVEKKVGRNDPCPCGSGKKYKNCNGRDL